MTSVLQLREELLDGLFSLVRSFLSYVVKMPTFSHMAIANIVNEGKAKFVITSNHDNMHRRAGMSILAPFSSLHL